MPEPLIRQLSSFLLFMAGGAILGLAFDLLQAIRAARYPRGLSAFVLDIVFWLIALAVTIPLLFAGTWGELRLYVWLAMAAGFCYYLLLPGSMIRPLLHAFCRWFLVTRRGPGPYGGVSKKSRGRFRPSLKG